MYQRMIRREECWDGRALPVPIEGHARTSAELLFGIGANPQQHGFEMLRDGVRVTAEQMPRCRRQSFDALFPLLGMMNGRSDECAGQEISAVIRVCWDRDEAAGKAAFPFPERPSASEAVYALAEAVLDRMAAKTNRK